MKLCLLILVSFALTFTASAKNKNNGAQLSPKLKKQVEKVFISFHQENQKLREQHQNELYEHQKLILKSNHKKTLNFFRDMSKLQQTISLGNMKENKKIQAEIERRKKIFKGKLHDDRRSARKKMSVKRNKFQKMMDKRRKSFKDKVKSLKANS